MMPVFFQVLYSSPLSPINVFHLSRISVLFEPNRDKSSSISWLWSKLSVKPFKLGFTRRQVLLWSISAIIFMFSSSEKNHSINAFAQRWSTPYATVTFQARQVSDLPGLKGLYVLRSAAI